MDYPIASMRRFRDTFDATRGDNEATRKHFDEVAKRANAAAERGRKLSRKDTEAVEKRTDKRPKPVSEPE
jgi:hypothetical protein